MEFDTARAVRANEPVQLVELVEFIMIFLKNLARLRSDFVFLKIFNEQIEGLHFQVSVRKRLIFIVYLLSETELKFNVHRKKFIQVVVLDCAAGNF